MVILLFVAALWARRRQRRARELATRRVTVAPAQTHRVNG
jgi:hypothetical protein